MSYVVTAPLVIARDSTGRQHHLYTDAPIMEDIDPAQLEQLVEAKMVAKVKAPKAEKSQPAGDKKPTAVKDILAEVGNDKAKAQEYLDEENAAEKPRTSLVEGLQAVLAAE